MKRLYKLPCLVRVNGRDGPNKLLNKKMWHQICQLVHLGQPHNIGDDGEQSNWVQLAYRDDISLL